MLLIIFFCCVNFAHVQYEYSTLIFFFVMFHSQSRERTGHDVSALSCLPSPLRGRLQCCCCFPCGTRHEDMATVIEDNCCRCNYAALSRMLILGEIEVVYATFHVDVGETPFFVALDYTKRKVRRCRRDFSSILAIR